MKYFLYCLLLYWVYQRFFAATINHNAQNNTRQSTNPPPSKPQEKAPNKEVGEFIDYEEVE